jgi:hypothetical protein
MSLANLVKTRQFKEESFDKKEFLGLFNSEKIRLKDANIFLPPMGCHTHKET